MASYTYTRLGLDTWDFTSTDPQLVEWYLDELKKAVHVSKVYAEKRNGKLIRASAKKGLRSQEIIAVADLQWSALERLCRDGWEPFAESLGRVSLRKRFEG